MLITRVRADAEYFEENVRPGPWLTCNGLSLAFTFGSHLSASTALGFLRTRPAKIRLEMLDLTQLGPESDVPGLTTRRSAAYISRQLSCNELRRRNPLPGVTR